MGDLTDPRQAPGRLSRDPGSTVICSDDNRNTWSAISPPFPAEQLRQIKPGRAEEPGTIYVGNTERSVFRSGDQGQTWTEIASGLPRIRSIEVIWA